MSQWQLYNIIFIRQLQKIMNQQFLKILSILLYLILMAGSAYTQETPLKIQLVHTEPWGYVVENTNKQDQKLVGIWLEVTEAIAKKVEVKFDLLLAPPARINRSLEQGNTDLSFLEQTVEKDAYVIYAGKLFTYGSIIVPRKDKEVRLNSYEDLYETRIGVVRGMSLNPKFDSDFELTLKQKFRNYEIIIGMLKLGRLDVIAGDSVALPYLLHKLNFEERVGSPLILQKTPVWVQFSKKSKQLHYVPRIRKAVEVLRKEGAFEQILYRYAGDRWKIE